jgi:hypothetical protein
VAVGDFNGDSDADLAVANFNDDNVSVLLNTTHDSTADQHHGRAVGAGKRRHAYVLVQLLRARLDVPVQSRRRNSFG